MAPSNLLIGLLDAKFFTTLSEIDIIVMEKHCGLMENSSVFADHCELDFYFCCFKLWYSSEFCPTKVFKIWCGGPSWDLLSCIYIQAKTPKAEL